MHENRQRAMVPEDILRIRYISDPQISPDGRKIAFVVTSLSQKKDAYLSNIWMVDTEGTEGGQAKRFTAGPKRDTAPRWSPDGSRLAFISERDDKRKAQLYIMPAAGGEPSRITDIKNGVANPVWSPDGRRIAFTAKVGGWQEPESEEEKQKSKPARVISNLKYKLNGEGFIHDRKTQIFVVEASEGSEPRQITSGDYSAGEPDWSPDGKTLAYAAAAHKERDYDVAADIWQVSAEGGEPKAVTTTAGPAASPTYSPDGELIAYSGHNYPTEFGRNMQIFTIPANGGDPICLSAALDRTCVSQPVWTGDGQSVIATFEDRGDVPLYRFHRSRDSEPERIAGSERQVTGLSLSPQARLIAFTATDAVSPAEVFICNEDGSGERQLTDLNGQWRAEVALARPERLKYERAGYELDCWVMKPIGFEPGKRYPALLNIHGGPHSQYGHNFFDEFQVYAGAGYVVIYTNPRGSQGYGEAFARAVCADWGGGDYADVMAGLDAALERFDFIDRDRLGVLGGSYGGYLTSWIVGHTDRFKAACSERAVNNLYSQFGTSDFGHLNAASKAGNWPWEDIGPYIERSPITYARNITTPLLIIHSENDLRCPIEQAEQLFASLKKQKKEVLFVRFPDENHELSRSGSPRHRLERFQIILDWFARYLQPVAAE